MPVQKPANSQGTLAKGTIGLLLVGVVAAAMVVAARRPANTTNESADMQMTMEQPQAMPAAAAIPATPTVSVAAKKPAAATGKTAAPKPSSPKMTVMVAQSPSAERPKTSTENTTITAQVTDPEAAAPQESAKIAAPAASPVTISGCLERDGDGFSLKDTAGANAPKMRSWKKGFLKKGAANIELLDSANRLKFKDHVGHRVSVTGILNDREMQARSMQRVPGVCS